MMMIRNVHKKLIVLITQTSSRFVESEFFLSLYSIIYIYVINEICTNLMI